MLYIERVEHIADEMQAVVESEWPELAHKLAPAPHVREGDHKAAVATR
jgi:hypothetical protein